MSGYTPRPVLSKDVQIRNSSFTINMTPQLHPGVARGVCSPAHHTPGRKSSDTRSPVSVARNQLPPFCTVHVPFNSYYIFEAGVLSRQAAADVVDPP